MNMNRRHFLEMMAGASALMAAGITPSVAATLGNTGISKNVVVVGGGMAGVTVAKYLRLWGGSGLKVTLIERESRYTSSIMSNLVLTDAFAMENLYFSYSALAANYGVRVVRGDAVMVDAAAKKVFARVNGANVAYPFDRAVIASGIDFLPVVGLETAAAQAKAPHAWKAGSQTLTLRQQLHDMPDGGRFILTIPAKPYRCPPGPYERACVVSDWLKRNKPRSKVLVFDANPNIIAEPNNFGAAFRDLYGNILTYTPGKSVSRLDVNAKRVYFTDGSSEYGDVLNIIPNQTAGGIVQASYLDNSPTPMGGRFAGVNVLSYESTAQTGVHIIGDSSATTQPKAGHVANQEAKVCADAMIRLFLGLPLDPAPLTNSACYSPITFETASWLSVVYQYDPVSKTMQPAPNAFVEAEKVNKDQYEEMFIWFRSLMTETFA